MVGLLSFVLAPPAQQGQGVPWWVWLLLLIVVIALLIWWLRRSEAKKPAGEEQAPAPAQAAPAPPPREAAAAPVEGAIAEEAGRAVEVPAAGEAAGEAVAVAAAAGPARRASGLRGPAAWRTRMWQPEPARRYLAWRYRRPPAVQPPPAAEPVSRAVEVPGPADDLTRIEGIGPKIAGLLQQAGIRTFRELAGADPGRLREILAEANLRGLADPGTWPEQAALAAAGKWEEFEALTARLKGGRRA